MCGIAGFVGEGAEKDLHAMIRTIQYRGPDDTGIFRRDNVGFAHARLSVLDLTQAGHQPMFNRDGSLALVFNGEIYNFKELRKELLELKPISFKSNSDTEVILYLHELFGEKCFSKLNGMFAIALYDFRRKKLILARDRLGKKPLYWAVFGSTLIFGSELKALLKHPLCRKSLRLESINKYLQFEYIPTPDTIFQNIYKLEQATFLTYQDGNIQKNKFWDISPDGGLANDQNILGTFEEKLESSVKRRLISDVPLGVFLSGGIDSATIAYYAQKNSHQKINTFSFGFEEKSFDESNYAQQVADALGTRHHHRLVTAADAVNTIKNIAQLIDEPMADSSIIPTFLLSRFCKEKITVALSGEGGDELMAGYPTFVADSLVPYYLAIPSFIRKYAFENLINRLPTSYNYFSLEFKLKKFVNGLSGDQKYRHFRWLGSFDRAQRQCLFNQNTWSQLQGSNEFEHIDNYEKGMGSTGPKNRILMLYQQTYLMDGVLVKVDRASMAQALEVRCPFLDYELVDFVNRLPYGIKQKGFRTKILLKKLMAGKLPPSVLHRKKQGFSIPLAFWLRDQLKGFCEEILSQRNVQKVGLFNYPYIDHLKRSHYCGKKNNAKEIWTLLVLHHWHQHYFNEC